MKKIALIIGVPIVLLMVALVGAGVWGYFRFVHTTPLTEAELAELTPDWDAVTRGNWSPWWDPGDGTRVWNPAASYNAWLASVPEEDKAWPLMLEAEYAHQPIYRNEYLGTMPTDGAEWELLKPVLASKEADTLLAKTLDAFNKPVMGVWWSSEDFEPYEHAAMVEYAESQPEPGPGEREVFQPGTLSFDPEANSAMLGVLLPSLGRQRGFTNFVRSKAAYELKQGKTELFVTSMERLLRSSDLSLEIPMLISVLVEAAIESVTIRAIDWGVTEHRDQFDAGMLERLENALAEHADARYLWEGEALMINDTLRRLGDLDGKLAPGAVASVQASKLGDPTSLPESQLHESSQRAMLVHGRILRAAIDHATLPWDGHAIDTDSILERERAKLNIIAWKVLEVIIPAVNRAGERIREQRQEVIGVRLGIAAHRHYERHGAFPESIDAIDDDLINFDPIDAFTGEPLGYTRTKTGPVVYSVGPDRIDNGGRQGWDTQTAWDDSNYRVKKRVEWWSQEEARALANNEDAQWDWVLFPMPPDDPEPIKDDYDTDSDLNQGGNDEDAHGEDPDPETDG